METNYYLTLLHENRVKCCYESLGAHLSCILASIDVIKITRTGVMDRRSKSHRELL
jgi:hypothetical protein